MKWGIRQEGRPAEKEVCRNPRDVRVLDTFHNCVWKSVSKWLDECNG